MGLPDIIREKRKHYLATGNFDTKTCGLPCITCRAKQSDGSHCTHVYDPYALDEVCPKCGADRKYCRNRICKASIEIGEPMCFTHYKVYYGVLRTIIRDVRAGGSGGEYLEDIMSLVDEINETGFIDLSVETAQILNLYQDILVNPDIKDTDKMKSYESMIRSIKELNQLAIQKGQIEEYVDAKVSSRLITAKAIAYQLILSLQESIFGKSRITETIYNWIQDNEPVVFDRMNKNRARIVSIIEESREADVA